MSNHPAVRAPRLWLVRLFPACATLLVLLGLAPSRAVGFQERPGEATKAEAPSESRFLRFEDDPTGGGTLQTSIVRYVNGEGVSVDLIGAVHVGDRAYYDLLNERFKSYDSLLYEMVKPRDADVTRRESGGGLSMIHMLQKAMQTVLELDYQLEGIDYGAENFVHADMDLETFARRQAEEGEGFLELILRQMLRDMTRPPDPDRQPPSMLEIMDAMGAPDRSRRLKLLFAREMSNMDDMLESFSGGDGRSVILDERNEAALKVLDQRLAKGEKRLGIFYGAAHLKGMEELLAERGFKQSGEPEWLIAWDMTLDGSGKEQMRRKVREAIVAEAVDGGRAPAAAADGGDLASLKAELAALRAESEALRKENEALRAQVQTLRDQNAALRDRDPD
jgi:hypothetical protein